MEHLYMTRGVCARSVKFDLDEGKVCNVIFTGGCNGNLKAIAKLVEGMEAEKVIELLEGNTCGIKATSCADQLTRGLRVAMAKEAGETA